MADWLLQVCDWLRMEEYIGLISVDDPARKCDTESKTETSGGVRSYQVNHLDCIKCLNVR